MIDGHIVPLCVDLMMIFQLRDKFADGKQLGVDKGVYAYQNG